jgi:hypothetical protein
MTHQIRQQFLEVELTGTEAEGLEIQRLLPELYYRKLLPAIEKAFDQSFPENQVLKIDRLEIDAGSINLDRLRQDFADSAIQEILKTLRADIYNNSKSSERSNRELHDQKTIPENLSDSFLYFLKTGMLPWSYRLKDGKTLEGELIDAINTRWSDKDVRYFTSRIQEALLGAATFKRFVNQFSQSFRAQVLSLISNEIAALTERIYSIEELEALSQEELLRFNRSLFESAFSLESGIANLKSELQENSLTKKTHASSVSEADIEGIYIENAGLVLLHPFLSLYFEALGVITGDGMLQPDRALCLLHFLATGQRQAPEYELVLPKILCGLSIFDPISSVEDISENESIESIALLTSVIIHWSALKNTSPDTLRGTFLMRPGKLFLREDGDWLLQVESQNFDILIDQLPWGISMIKLPWMKQMLIVEWVV